MLKPLTPRESFEFIPQSERDLPPEEQTVFKLREITLADRYRIKDAVEALETGAGAKISGLGTNQLLTIRLGLVGVVRNFPQEVLVSERVFGEKRKVPALEWLEQIPGDVLDEIYEALISRMRVSTEEGKG